MSARDPETLVPVYIVTGFLESGKTRFVNEMLADEGFSEGERTLILMCEEGEEEYGKKLLKKSNSLVEAVESAQQLADGLLNRLDEKYQPERIIVEYNAMWMLQALYDAPKPECWDLAQIVTLVDANTFDLYLKNMQKVVSDGLREADLVIFNRCGPDTPKSVYRRRTLALNNTCRIYFENTDGTMDDGVSDDDLPYDMTAEPIVVEDDQFGVWYIDAMENSGRYDGKVLKLHGKAFFPKGTPKKCFVFGRYAMTCCAEDIRGIGFVCQWKGEMPGKDAWITLTAKAEKAYSPIHGREAIVLVGQDVQPAEPMKEELVYFN